MTPATHNPARTATEIAALKFELRGFFLVAAYLALWVALIAIALAFLE